MKDHSRKQTTRLNRRARRIEGRRQKVQGFSLTQHHWHVKVYSSKDRAGMTAKTWLFLSISPGRLDYFFRGFFFLSDTSMPGCKIKRTTILYRILLSVLQAMWGLLCFDEERQTSWKKQNSISFSLEDFEVTVPGPTTSSCMILFIYFFNRVTFCSLLTDLQWDMLVDLFFFVCVEFEDFLNEGWIVYFTPTQVLWILCTRESQKKANVITIEVFAVISGGPTKIESNCSYDD